MLRRVAAEQFDEPYEDDRDRELRHRIQQDRPDLSYHNLSEEKEKIVAEMISLDNEANAWYEELEESIVDPSEFLQSFPALVLTEEEKIEEGTSRKRGREESEE